MFDFLKQPYKYHASKKEKWLTIPIMGLFIFLFLFLFKPFGMAQLKTSFQFFVSLGYGFVTSFVVFIFSFLFSKFINENKWTFGKNIIWEFCLISSIGIANFFFYIFVFSNNFEFHFTPIYFKYLLYSIWGALLVGVIPVTINYMLYFNKKYKKALSDASISVEEITWEDEVVIRAGNPKNNYTFNPKSIVYISSNDNYISVAIHKGESISKTHIRGTLKAVELELIKNNQFVRCHKCFIVNLQFIDRAIGNAQNMKLIVNQSDIEIPVSRSSVPTILERIKIK